MRCLHRMLSLVVAVAVLTLAAEPSHALDCKEHPHIASAKGGFRALTAVNARSAWRASVREHEGLNWMLWRLAKFKATRCAQAGQDGPWICVARANPCKPGN